jgi:hypothetical protein
MPGLRRHQRPEAHLGLRGRIEGIRGTQPREFERLRVRWRLQLSGLTFNQRLRRRSSKPAEVTLLRPAGDGS